jgi:hypothetical protein
MTSGKRLLALAVLGALSLTGVSTVEADSLTYGNALVVRMGDGVTALASGAFPVYVDEYSPTGTLVQTIGIPSTSLEGNGTYFTGNPNATTEGILKVSQDGRYFTLGGYQQEFGTAGTPSTATSVAVPRLVARVDLGGSVAISAGITDAFSGQSFRSAATDDGSQYWLNGEDASTAGSNNGVRYVNSFAATTSTLIREGNSRSIQVAGSNLYYSTGAGTTRGVFGYTGLPTTAAAPSVTIAGGASPFSVQDFMVLDLDPSVAGVDTAYVSEGGSSTLIKYTSTDGTTWTAQGSVSTDLGGNIGKLQDVGAYLTPDGVRIYATNIPSPTSLSAGSISVLATLIDTNTTVGTGISASSFTQIATAGSNYVFRGTSVALPEPGSLGIIGATIMYLLRRRHRRTR